MRFVHLIVSYAHVNLCHFFSSSCCRGLAAASACVSSWTFLFTFLISVRFLSFTSAFTPSVHARVGARGQYLGHHRFCLIFQRLWMDEYYTWDICSV